MNDDKKIFERMIENDIDSSILVETIGLDRTIQAYRQGNEETMITNIIELIKQQGKDKNDI